MKKNKAIANLFTLAGAAKLLNMNFNTLRVYASRGEEDKRYEIVETEDGKKLVKLEEAFIQEAKRKARTDLYYKLLASGRHNSAKILREKHGPL